MKIILILFLIVLSLFTGPFIVLATHQVDLHRNWQTASRESAKIAPDPMQYRDAVVEVYSARTYSWRGLFAVHTWISVKPKDAKQYTVYQVIGWRVFWRLPILSKDHDIPDRMWFGNQPKLLKDIRGKKAEILIEKIKTAVGNYPDKTHYVTWPGPNSNTFIAAIARAVPELELAMPSNAIGKDYLGKWNFFAKAPSGHGYQFSLSGLFGILISPIEGLEINIIGLVFGINFTPLGIIVPGIGLLCSDSFSSFTKQG